MCAYSVRPLLRKLKPITSAPFHFCPRSYHSLPFNYFFNSCSSFSDLKCIHALIFQHGSNQNLLLSTKLVTLASSMAPTMDYARKLFDTMPKRDAFLWNTLIRGYADRGPCHEAIVLYRNMHHSGLSPDNYTFPFVVRSCTVQLALREGKECIVTLLNMGFIQMCLFRALWSVCIHKVVKL